MKSQTQVFVLTHATGSENFPVKMRPILLYNINNRLFCKITVMVLYYRNKLLRFPYFFIFRKVSELKLKKKAFKLAVSHFQRQNPYREKESFSAC